MKKPPCAEDETEIHPKSKERSAFCRKNPSINKLNKLLNSYKELDDEIIDIDRRMQEEGDITSLKMPSVYYKLVDKRVEVLRKMIPVWIEMKKMKVPGENFTIEQVMLSSTIDPELVDDIEIPRYLHLVKKIQAVQSKK